MPRKPKPSTAPERFKAKAQECRQGDHIAVTSELIKLWHEAERETGKELSVTGEPRE